MMNEQFFLQTPQLVTVVNDNGRTSKQWQGQQTTVAETKVTYDLTAQGVAVKISSAVPVSFVRLRWEHHFDSRAQFLADEVERGYGTMGWQKLTPNRIMPWYFMENHGDTTTGYGVMTQPNAFCFWQADPAGITLIMDVRNGGSSFELGDRQLTLATVVSEKYAHVTSFVATQRFCHLMSPHPVLPK